jgi:SAM-dependent methyltransferase
MSNQQERLKTVNNMGFIFLNDNPIVNTFLVDIEKTKGYVADVGCAYGPVSLLALEKGAKVMAIDLEQEHLEVLKQNCPMHLVPYLETVKGHFPNTVSLPSNAFDAMLLARLLIFLNPEEIDRALLKAYQALKTGGYLYIISPSPLRKKWQALFPTYMEQKEQGLPWPGYIQNLWELVPEEQKNLPNTIQLIDIDSLKNGLERVGFKVSSCLSYPNTSCSEEEKDNLSCAIAYK